MPPECLNFRVLDYYLPKVPVYAVIGLSDPAPAVHHPLVVSVGDSANICSLCKPREWSEPIPPLPVEKDRVLLLHLKSLHVEVRGKYGSTQEVVTEDRDDRLDIYQIYVLRLTPTSSVDITSGRHTISVVE
jgi:hypothetical protein